MKESMCSRWHLRLIVLLILFFPLTLSAAQGRVTVKGQSITLRQAIKIIESSSNFKFFFNRYVLIFYDSSFLFLLGLEEHFTIFSSLKPE